MKASIPKDRAGALTWPSAEMQRFCPVCGASNRPMESHHVVPRSLGGKDGPQVPLCKVCHAAADDYAVRLRYDGSAWLWSPLADTFAGNLAAALGHTIHRGSWYPCVFGEDNRDALPEAPYDEERAGGLIETIATNNRMMAVLWRENAEAVKELKAVTGKHFREVREEAGIPASEATKQILVASTFAPGDLATVSPRIQVLAAKAAKDVGKAKEFLEIIDDAHALSESDFKVKWFGAPEPADKRECPTCHSKVPKERLEEAR